MKVKTLWLVIVLALLLSSFASGCKPDYSFSFEKADCQFEMTVNTEIKCGYLIVPEDRERRDSPAIRIHVAIVRSSNPKPAPDPVVLLNGGPGGNTLEAMGYWLQIFNLVLLDRDLIFLDQRGAGYSEPSLNCPEAEEQWYQDWGRNIYSVTETQNYLQVLQACHDRLTAEGVDPAAYTSAANAADVEDLRKALGYSEWNLYGISYGTRLALTIMRDHPEGVRSVILDSVYPPQVDLYTSTPLNLERSLNLLFDGCAADPKCSQKFPNLERTFYELVDQLDAQPLELSLFRPSSGKAYKAVLNGDRMIGAIFSLLYSTEEIPNLPRHIANIKDGRTLTFSWLLTNIVFSGDYSSEGMNISVQCSEEFPFSSKIDAQEIIANVHPRLIKAAFSPQENYLLCSSWNTNRPAAIENKPVTSDIPTLILSGEFDPITPPSWGRLAAETLEYSQYLEFPGFGHGVLGSGPKDGECPKQIVNSFITNPNTTVDASCIHSIEPPFKP